MFPFKKITIRNYEIGLRFHNGEFRGLLGEGRHRLFDPWGKTRVDVVSRRDPWLVHEKLDVVVRSGALTGRAVVVDLKDYQRALVWIDGRFSHVLPPGLYAYWTDLRDVAVEIVDARQVRFEHKDSPLIVRSTGADRVLDVFSIEQGYQGVLFYDGRYVETLASGRYAFWKGIAQVKVVQLDVRETMIDVVGQDIMTADKVTLRLNAIAAYRIVDARAAVAAIDDVRQAMYREVQLALRAVVGVRDLDAFLADKDAPARETEEQVRRRVGELGLELISVGVRDVILPGDMKDLMNKVTEAKKAAEANLIVRREETAAMRSQVNTAKLLQDNPTLMRLRELELLEKIAATSKLNIVLGEKGPGEKGLAEKVMSLL
jgi:regulator of protease activity HflC (stomatin/prohibitin superfamily)